MRDAAWIAGLLRHGLLRPSFIPDRAQREVRDLTRYRMSLVDERSAEVNRLQKVLEDANLKVAGIATDILGKSGREMLDRIVAGETDAVRLAQCARGRMKAKIPLLEAALAGTVDAHHRWLLARMLARIDDLDALITDLSAQIGQRLAPPWRMNCGIYCPAWKHPHIDSRAKLRPASPSHVARVILA